MCVIKRRCNRNFRYLQRILDKDLFLNISNVSYTKLFYEFLVFTYSYMKILQTLYKYITYFFNIKND